MRSWEPLLYGLIFAVFGSAVYLAGLLVDGLDVLVVIGLVIASAAGIPTLIGCIALGVELGMRESDR